MLWFEGHILVLRKSVCLCFLNSILVFIQVHVYMYVIYVWGCPWRPEEGIRYPGTGVIENVSCLIWVLGMELKSTEDGQAPLTTERSLQSHYYYYYSAVHITQMCTCLCATVCLWSQRTAFRSFFFFLLLFGFWGENPGQQAWQEMPLLMSQTFILKQDTKNTETGASKMAQWLRYLPTSLIT